MYFVSDQLKWAYGLCSKALLSEKDWEQLYDLLEVEPSHHTALKGSFVGGVKGMETPWGTSAQEILDAMGLGQVYRIERFRVHDPSIEHDPLLECIYEELSASYFTSQLLPRPEKKVKDVSLYNQEAHLSLDESEVALLESYAHKLGRPLTETEVFGWAQIHSEHCRHKTFNASFVCDGKPYELSLFDWIRSTSTEAARVVSAYKDNVAFLSGPRIKAWITERGDRPSFFREKSLKTILSLKAETHNFPTTVEPFYGASTGTGGEIRDRMAGGQGSIPLAGTAVYMTPYARLGELKPWERALSPRPWLYQRPDQLLIKSSNGASDYANKFGQPLICGSLLTFEYQAPSQQLYAYDKVVMLAGGVGWAQAAHLEKKPLRAGHLLILLGGSNYRIGMGGGSVSSVSTGNYTEGTERQAIQRAHPEMQKRVFDCLRALLERDENPVLSIHDHGAGGHLNCFSELLEASGGDIHIDALPLGDHSLSYREILCNESQERMGIVIEAQDLEQVQAIARREGCPLYVVGEVTADDRIRCIDRHKKQTVVDLPTSWLMAKGERREVEVSSPRGLSGSPLSLDIDQIHSYAEQVMSLEGVASKDWLTNKVDRCVGGRVAMQPCCGPLQLPLNNLGVVKLDFSGHKGIATALGHAPGAALLSAEVGSRLSLARALSNLVWAPLSYGRSGISLSANWMWPQGAAERGRLYEAVASLAREAKKWGVNIPTGKDSLSMQQHYPSGEVVAAPGTVILSAVSEVKDVRALISPLLRTDEPSSIWYLPWGKEYHLGGSALAQTFSEIGDLPPDPLPAEACVKAFDAIQRLIEKAALLSGHDVGGGGILTTLLELCFSDLGRGMSIDLSAIEAPSLLHLLFSESPGVVLQLRSDPGLEKWLSAAHLGIRVGEVIQEPSLQIKYRSQLQSFDVDRYRKIWFARSAELDACQRPPAMAAERASRLTLQPLRYRFPSHFNGKWPTRRPRLARASILRERGSNSDREVAYALHRAGFQVKDIHMSDLTSGRDQLEDTDFLVFVGGFSYGDVLGAAKGWASIFRQHQQAIESLDNFYDRADVLSMGICNGCQLMAHLKLLAREHPHHPYLEGNLSQQFECAFVGVEVMESPSLLFGQLAGLRLGAWVAHREGRFRIPEPKDFPLVARYAYAEYPAMPNGSDLSAACLCSADGRHHAIMPHIERSLQPSNWAYYPLDRARKDEVSPWILPFVSARDWLLKG